MKSSFSSSTALTAKQPAGSPSPRANEVNVRRSITTEGPGLNEFSKDVLRSEDEA
jgi:hypothetical protein